MHKNMSKTRHPAKIENLGKFMGFVSDFVKAEGFTEKRIREIELATEEALLNIFNYAYPEGVDGEVEVRCRMDEKSGLIMEILDSGKPFDVQSVPDPDLSLDVSDRKIGGLGILLIKKMVDEVQYRREGESNILTFVVHKKR
jgi:anti-sigma regulatory factor (Ser/Thr protein kinase)